MCLYDSVYLSRSISASLASFCLSPLMPASLLSNSFCLPLIAPLLSISFLSFVFILLCFLPSQLPSLLSLPLYVCLSLSVCLFLMPSYGIYMASSNRQRISRATESNVRIAQQQQQSVANKNKKSVQHNKPKPNSSISTSK